jgi:hypothetical protein
MGLPKLATDDNSTRCVDPVNLETDFAISNPIVATSAMIRSLRLSASTSLRHVSRHKERRPQHQKAISSLRIENRKAAPLRPLDIASPKF